jgi:hypothetical protein
MCMCAMEFPAGSFSILHNKQRCISCHFLLTTTEDAWQVVSIFLGPTVCRFFIFQVHSEMQYSALSVLHNKS